MWPCHGGNSSGVKLVKLVKPRVTTLTAAPRHRHCWWSIWVSEMMTCRVPGEAGDGELLCLPGPFSKRLKPPPKSTNLAEGSCLGHFFLLSQDTFVTWRLVELRIYYTLMLTTSLSRQQLWFSDLRCPS